ncbi:MAG: hypothetical protein IIB53_03510 [Planctomycetes bacterium]|nr:hypothetical protein [Planctomycetota bacterium]
MRGQRFLTAPDEIHEGVFKGFIQGYNLLRFAKKFYDVIVYNPRPFKFLDVKSWFEPDRIAYLSAEKIKDYNISSLRNALSKIDTSISYEKAFTYESFFIKPFVRKIFGIKSLSSSDLTNILRKQI